MLTFEYKVVPAPRKGEKQPGVRAAPDRFALTLATLMNDLGRDGWEYLRADTLPCEERVGLTGRTTVFQNMLIFRRQVAAAVSTLAPNIAPSPAPSFGPDPVAVRAPMAPSPVPTAPSEQARDLVAKAAIARPVPLKPVQRVMADYATLPSRPPVFRKLTADAPLGEAPRISLVPQSADSANADGSA